jgi:CheY-like chemotaxis protein
VHSPVPPSSLRPLAHELRNAIAPVRNAAHLLRKRAGTDPLIASAIQTIDAAVTQSLRLLDRAVDAERVMQGEVAIAQEDVDLAAVIQRAVDDTAAAVADKKQRVQLDVRASPLRVRGDAARLAQSVATLIDNASRYSDEGAQIEVTVDARDDESIVRVRDHGIGIAAPYLSRVFEPFAQPDDSTASARSIAMSLPVARRLVELHGGRLAAASDGAGRGSEFVIALPRPAQAAEATPTQSSTPRAEGGAATGRRVLLVDDNRAVRETYADLLAELGCEVDTAADGEQAITRALAWAPRFVILDINLPKRNGYEVARTLRARFGRDAMTLVMISGTLLDDATLARARAAGFDHCLDKASDLATLERLLATG